MTKSQGKDPGKRYNYTADLESGTSIEGLALDHPRGIVDAVPLVRLMGTLPSDGDNFTPVITEVKLRA